MSTPTPPQPGPGQQVVRLTWQETVEHVAYLVTPAPKGPIPQEYLERGEAVWESCISSDRNVLHSGGVWEHRRLGSRVHDIHAVGSTHGGITEEAEPQQSP